MLCSCDTIGSLGIINVDRGKKQHSGNRMNVIQVSYRGLLLLRVKIFEWMLRLLPTTQSGRA